MDGPVPTSTSVTCVQISSCDTVIRVTEPHQRNYSDWEQGREREGYLASPPTPTYVPVPKPPSKPGGRRYLFSIRAEERCGGLLAAAGAAWATYVATFDYASLWQMQILPPGPVEVCALGILVWLHAKWRRSTRID
jgi:hypothetical protein